MNDDIFDKPSEAEIDKIHEVDLKEKWKLSISTMP